MFSYQRIWCPQAPQRERGVASPSGVRTSSCASIVRPASAISAGCGLPKTVFQTSPSPSMPPVSSSHSRIMMIGLRWITTLRKLPTSNPRMPRTTGDPHSAHGSERIASNAQTTWPILKMGRYIDTTMPPISVPSTTMMIGSISVDRPLTISSTSSS
jgi:hypothetical protein